jgi:bifunctional non-homologous end joining protein LigD
MVVACSDGRLQEATDAFLAREFKITRYDRFYVPGSPHKEAALEGLERWKARHLDAASHLAVDDVLVDLMRGRSSTWTRIRVNLRHVPREDQAAAGDSRPRR